MRLAVPPALRNTVRLLQFATGRIVSRTVTTDPQVAVLEFRSVTVSTTGLFPVSRQKKLPWFTVSLSLPVDSLLRDDAEHHQ